MNNTLVIYYSRDGENYVNGHIETLKKGNTQIAAEYIKKICQADLFRVETVKEYNKDYMKCTEEARDELRKHVRPELKAYLDSVKDYDNIVVAGPCWWGTYPMAVFTQLERLDFSGKKVLPLMTHEGSGLGNCVHDLKKCCKGADIGRGLSVHGADVRSAETVIEKWLKENLK